MKAAVRILQTRHLAGRTLEGADTSVRVLYLDGAGVDADVVEEALDLLPHQVVVLAGENSLLQRLHLHMTSRDDSST